MRRTLALDQASRTTGWAVFDNKKVIGFGHFSISANKTIGERLESFIKDFNVLIETYHPEKIYFEGIQYQNNAETYKKLAMIQAMVIYWSREKQIESLELTPSHWRSVIKDKHNIKFGRTRAEQKAKSKQFVEDYFELLASEDESDAICLGYAGILEDEKYKSAF